MLPSTLGLYVAKRFFGAILGSFVVCMVLIFMIDLVELLRQARNAKAVTLPHLMWIGLLRLPSFSEILLPFGVLVGSIGALLSLSRKSELTVMRAGGMSVWQFIRPGIVVAGLLGLASTTLYNPIAAKARAQSERLMAEAFGKDINLLKNDLGGAWLRQEGADGASVINAKVVANRGLSLGGILVFRYNRDGTFKDRIDAERAVLNDGYWDIHKARISRPGQEPESIEVLPLGTYLSRERIQDALGTVDTVSVHEIPDVIDMAERAKLPTERLRMQYQLLLSRPALLMAMVLLAATVSLRSFRMGGVQTMVVTGIVGGVGFFLLTEVSRQIGLAGLVPAAVAVWTPISMAVLAALTVLLHQEDG